MSTMVCSRGCYLSIGLSGNIKSEREAEFSSALFRDLVQSVEHRLAGDSEKPAERLIQFQNQKNSARDSDGRNDEGENNGRIARCEHAKTQENEHQPGDEDNQHRLRN